MLQNLSNMSHRSLLHLKKRWEFWLWDCEKKTQDWLWNWNPRQHRQVLSLSFCRRLCQSSWWSIPSKKVLLPPQCLASPPLLLPTSSIGMSMSFSNCTSLFKFYFFLYRSSKKGSFLVWSVFLCKLQFFFFFFYLCLLQSGVVFSYLLTGVSHSLFLHAINIFTFWICDHRNEHSNYTEYFNYSSK